MAKEMTEIQKKILGTDSKNEESKSVEDQIKSILKGFIK